MAIVTTVSEAQRRPATIDAIAKGLDVAKSLLGVDVDTQKLQLLKQEQALKNEAANRDMRIKAEEDDAAGPLSKTVREHAKRMGVVIPDTVSAGALQRSPLGEMVKFAAQRDAEKAMKLSEIGAKGAEDRKTKGFEAGLPSDNPNKEAFARLPIEHQEQIKDLARATASKTDIKNHIDSALEILNSPQVSEQQKIVAGENLLKTLNSAEGKDAVGAEESKRLGSFLQYKMGNFTGPGSFIGRDLDEFTAQVGLKSQELGQAADRNKSRIDTLYGRIPSEVGSISIPQGAAPHGKKLLGGRASGEAIAGGGGFDAEDLQALQWAKSNPKDPRAGAIVSRLRAKGLK